MSIVLIILMVGEVLGMNSAPTSSTEVIQGLDLSGKWKGYWWFENSGPLPAELKDGDIRA